MSQMLKRVSVRPVQWNRLLDAIELIASKVSVNIDLFRTRMGVSAQQSQEIARALHNMGFVDRVGSELIVRPALDEFIKLWEQGDLRGLSQLLQQRYLPYQRFITLLREQGSIKISKNNNEIMVQPQQNHALIGNSKPGVDKGRQRLVTQDEQELIHKLNEFGLNLASFNMLTRLAASLGAVYVSDGYVSFSENLPSQQQFEDALLEEYKRFKIPEGYASIVEVADAVCHKLGISMLAFDEYFRIFYETNYSRIKTSSAVMLKPKTPKEMVFLQKRRALPRFDRRQLVDGVNIGRLNVKAFKVVRNG